MLIEYLMELIPGDFERVLIDGLGGIGGISPWGKEVIPWADPLVGRDGIGGGGPISSPSISIMCIHFDESMVKDDVEVAAPLDQGGAGEQKEL